MRKSRVILGFAVFVLLNYPFLFAGEFISSKEDTITLAFKEEAIRRAFQEAEINVLSQSVEESKGFPDLLPFLHPYFNTGVVYNDNIWLTKDNAQSDLYLDFTPGIKLTLGNFEESYTNRLQQGLELDLGAEITHSFYKGVALNRESPYAGLSYSLESGRNKINLSNFFKRGYTLQSQLSVDTEGLVGYQSNNTVLGWEHSFNRLGLGLGYRRSVSDYYKDYKVSNTSEDNMGVITGFFKVTPKTRVFLEYNYGQYEYTRAITSANDYNYSKFWVGGQGDFTKKLSGLAKFGYQNTEYSVGTEKNTMTIDTGLTYKQSPRNTFFLSLFYGDLSTDYTDQGLDKQTSVSLGLMHSFNRRLSLRGNLSFAKDNYDSGRVDDTYSYSLSLDYAFRKWMKISLDYDYNNSSSTNANAGYRSNKYSLKTQVGF